MEIYIGAKSPVLKAYHRPNIYSVTHLFSLILNSFVVGFKLGVNGFNILTNNFFNLF